MFPDPGTPVPTASRPPPSSPWTGVLAGEAVRWKIFQTLIVKSLTLTSPGGNSSQACVFLGFSPDSRKIEGARQLTSPTFPTYTHTLTLHVQSWWVQSCIQFQPITFQMSISLQILKRQNGDPESPKTWLQDQARTISPWTSQPFSEPQFLPVHSESVRLESYMIPLISDMILL